MNLVSQGGKLKTYGTRIGFILDQKLQYEVRFQHSRVSRSICDRTVGDLKQDLKAWFQLRRRCTQAAVQQFGGLESSLDAPANLEKAPPNATSGVFHQQSRESRKRQDDAVQQIESAEVALLGVCRCEARKLRVQLLKHTPCIRRQPFLQVSGDSPQFSEIPAQARYLRGVVHHFCQYALDRPSLFSERCRQGSLGEVGQPGEQSNRGFQRNRPSKILFTGKRRPQRANETHSSFDPFRVAAEPIKIVSDSAGQIVGGLLN